MWVVKAYPKKWVDGRPLCSWHHDHSEAKESAKICRSKRVYKKVIIEKESEEEN